MTIGEAIAVAAAGFAAGGVNTIVGSGSLITFPTLLAVGYSSVVANVSNSVGLVPGGISGVDLARSVSRSQPDMAVLLTTGYAGDRMDTAPANLPWPVLRKPFQIDQLAEIASALLAGRDVPPKKRPRKRRTSADAGS